MSISIDITIQFCVLFFMSNVKDFFSRVVLTNLFFNLLALELDFIYIKWDTTTFGDHCSFNRDMCKVLWEIHGGSRILGWSEGFSKEYISS